MPSVYNYLSEKLFEITYWKNWSTLHVFGWFAQRICLFCLSACLCQIPVTGAQVLGRELGSSAEPSPPSCLLWINPSLFPVVLHALEHIRCQGRRLLWPLGALSGGGVEGKDSKRTRQKWRKGWRARMWIPGHRKWVETATGVVLDVEIVVTRQLGGSVPVVIPLSPLSSFRAFVLCHPHHFTLLPKPSALGWGICAK